MPRVEACILAGGLSSRMGQDKAKLKLGGKSLLAHARAAAISAGLPVRVIRHDLVPRCGPLGGVYTALQTTRAEIVVFLSCDMPFVTPAVLEGLLAKLAPDADAVFSGEDKPGFPFVLRATALTQVKELLRCQRFALSGLARALRASLVSTSGANSLAAVNVNTPSEYSEAKRMLKSRRLTRPGELRRSERPQRD